MIAEYIADFGLDAGKNYVKDKLDERKLRADLKSYVEQWRKYNDMASLAEEIDLEGLLEYILQDLLTDVDTRVFAARKKDREKARKHIVAMACAHAQATMGETKCQVSKCIAMCLDIIRNFYSKNTSVKDYILSGEVVDAIAENSAENTQRIVDVVKKSSQTIIETMTNGSLFSYDRAIRMAKDGHAGDVGTGIQQMLKHITLEHPLYPDYGYDYIKGNLRSVPLRKEAKKQYPIRYKFEGVLKVGDRYFEGQSEDPVSYAYRHQLPITMAVSKAERYLGNVMDPVQADLKEVTELHVDPPEFPPAFACAIKVGTQTFYEYVLLRVREILDDGMLVINNDEQEGHFYFEVRIDPNDSSKSDFKLNMHDGNNREHLNYAMFMKALKEVKDLHIYVLEAGEDIIKGRINDVQLETGFSSLDEEIDFLERLCAIEEYFNVTLAPEGEISDEEYEAVLELSNLVRDGEVTGTWGEASVTGVIDSRFREEILAMDAEPHVFSYVGIHHVELFGASFDFRFMRSFQCAYVADLEKVKRKVEVLEDGDSIKMTFRPGEDRTVTETLRIPEAG